MCFMDREPRNIFNPYFYSVLVFSKKKPYLSLYLLAFFRNPIFAYCLKNAFFLQNWLMTVSKNKKHDTNFYTKIA